MLKTTISLLAAISIQAYAGTDENIQTPDLSQLPPITTHALPSIAPETNIERIVEVFGHDLSRLPTPVANFLLGVGFDKTAPNSLTFNEPIGVPYIAYTGAEYWLKEYSNHNDDIATLLNTVIVLLLNQRIQIEHDLEDDIDTVITRTLNKLEQYGFWPASYLLAERAFIEAETTTPSMQTIIQAMDKMAHCADVNFAPCQMRLALQLHSNPKAQHISMDVLKMSLRTYLMDKRYIGHDKDVVNVVKNLISQE